MTAGKSLSINGTPFSGIFPEDGVPFVLPKNADTFKKHLRFASYYGIIKAINAGTALDKSSISTALKFLSINNPT